jgi:hypothetical protein
MGGSPGSTRVGTHEQHVKAGQQSPKLEFGRFMRRGRGRFPCAAKYGVEFLHGPGLAGT